MTVSFQWMFVLFFNKEFDALSALPQPSPHRENQAAKVKQTGENNVRELCHNFLTSFSGLIFVIIGNTSCRIVRSY